MRAGHLEGPTTARRPKPRHISSQTLTAPLRPVLRPPPQTTTTTITTAASCSRLAATKFPTMASAVSVLLFQKELACAVATKMEADLVERDGSGSH